MIFGRYNWRPPNELANATEAVDRFNASRVEEIIGEIGWPTYNKVGHDGAHATWSIIQHAVFNPPLMKLSLEKMKIALENNQIDGVDYAYLYDRFNAVSFLGKQDYGIVRNVPIRDEYEVEKRRKEIGFEITLTEYLGEYKTLSEKEYLTNEKEIHIHYKEAIHEGEEYLLDKNYEQAFEFYSVAMECNGFIQTKDIYNYARVLGFLDTRRTKFSVIKMARSLSTRGFNDVDRLKNDVAFDKIRQDENWKEIIGIIEKIK